MVTNETLVKLSQDIPSTCWMAHVLANKPLVSEHGLIQPYLRVTKTPGSTTEQPVDAVVLSVDLGNVAAKLGLVNGQGKFQYVRIPTAYARAKSTQFGVSIPQFKVTSDAPEEQEPFYIGDYAVEGGDALPLGPTHERLANARYRRFFKAGIVQALLEGGYRPGTFTLALGLGLRNEEIEDVEGKQTIQPLTRTAIRELCGTFTVQYRDMRGNESEWTLIIEPARIYCVAQTLGSFFAFYWTLEGMPAQNRVKHLSIIDFGGGDTQVMDVRTIQVGRAERFSTHSDRIGDGTVEIAKALQEAIREQYHMPITLAEAQMAMIRHTIPYMGQDNNIELLLQGIKSSRTENLLGRALPSMQNKAVYTFNTGGGSILMLEEIVHQMHLAGKEPGDYLVAPASLAGILNCLGILAYAYIKLSRYKVVEQGQQQQTRVIEGRKQTTHAGTYPVPIGKREVPDSLKIPKEPKPIIIHNASKQQS